MTGPQITIRPLVDYEQLAKRMGFRMLWSIEDPQGPLSPGIVAIKLEPANARTREAVIRASGSARLDAIETHTKFGPDDEFVDVVRDTAAAAIEKAAEIA